MNRLESIQKNPSEFHIGFNMKELIGQAMLCVFADENNKKIMEYTLRTAMKIDMPEIRIAIVASKFDEFVDEFLKEEIYDGLGLEEEREDDADE